MTSVLSSCCRSSKNHAHHHTSSSKDWTKREPQVHGQRIITSQRHVVQGWSKVATNHGNGTSEAMFRLYNITVQDWGEYVCVAKNAVDEDRRTVYLRSKLYLLLFKCSTNSSFRLHSTNKNNSTY